MKKLSVISLAILMVFMSWSASTAFAELSLNFAIGRGNDSSTTYDPYAQYTFNPWVSGENFELRPFATGGMTFWDDHDTSDSVWGILASLGLRLAYTGGDIQPYLSLNAGPSYISQKQFVHRDLGGHFIFNTRVMLGLSFGQDLRHTISAHGTHYSNARTQSENDGFNTYGLAYGFSFY